MDNVWEAMLAESEKARKEARAQKWDALRMYHHGYADALEDWEGVVHKREIEWAGEVARQRDAYEARLASAHAQVAETLEELKHYLEREVYNQDSSCAHERKRLDEVNALLAESDAQ